jgi:hypothetical protein
MNTPRAVILANGSVEEIRSRVILSRVPLFDGLYMQRTVADDCHLAPRLVLVLVIAIVIAIGIAIEIGIGIGMERGNRSR